MLLPILMHDISNNNASLNILKLFQLKNLQQTYVQHGIIHLGEFLGTYISVVFPDLAKNCETKYRVACEIYPKEFQRAEFHRLLLYILVKETDYIETPIIIQKVRLTK